jgi:phospholipase/carboxylesterase
MRAGVESAAATLDAFLDSELQRLNLPPERLALVGFSQGTMLSLHVGLARAKKPAAIVGYSGLLAGLAPPAQVGAPPIFLSHGDTDTMIPPAALFDSANSLGNAGYGVQWHLARGVGHGIDPDGLALGGMFLALAFRGILERKAEKVSCAL